MSPHPHSLVPFIVCGLLAAGSLRPVAAQLAEQVVDLLADGRATVGSRPANFTKLGNRVVFFAGTQSQGREPWVTDGTSGNTFELLDACPGSCSSGPVVANLPARLLWLTSRLVDDDARLTEIFSTDGTRAGTFALPLPELRDDDLSQPFGTLDDVAYFSWKASEAAGEELWRSDGTAAGTFLVRHLVPGAPGSRPRGFVNGGDKLYFVAEDGVNFELEIWETDGTAAGTRKLVSADPQARIFDAPALEVTASHVFFLRWPSPPSQPSLWAIPRTGGAAVRFEAPGVDPDSGFALGTLGDLLFFAAEDDTHGRELWRSDGTPAGTFRVSDFAPEVPFEFRLDGQVFAALADVAFLAAHDGVTGRLFRLDGTAGGIEPVDLPCRDGGQPARIFDQPGLTTLGPRLFLRATCPDGDTTMVVGATGAGADFRTLCPGGCPRFDLSLLQRAGGRFLFATRGAQNRSELWQTNGTPAGTRLLARFPVGAAAIPIGEVAWIAAAGTGFVLGVFTAELGTEPWVTTGGSLVPRLLLDVDQQVAGASPGSLAAFGSTLLFFARDQASGPAKLFTAFGPAVDLLHAPSANGSLSGLLAAANMAFFFEFGSISREVELWATDGSPAGTRQLATFSREGSADAALPGELVRVGEEVAFTVDTPDERGLWATDGTLAGTRRLVSYHPDETQRVGAVATDGTGLFYSSFPFEGADTLWRTDLEGSPPEPILQGREEFLLDLELRSMTRLGDRTFFIACHREFGGLWTTDGTAGGTANVPLGLEVDLDEAGDCRLFDEPFVQTPHGAVFLVANDSDQLALVVSDGSPGGTSLLAEGELEFQLEDELEALGGSVLLAFDDLASGRELWVTDGTPGGTRLLKDVFVGRESSFPQDLTAVGNRAFFVASDGGHGRELWVTDGTAAGTRLVQDLFPGPQSSDPKGLTVAGDRLYFSADDGLTGRELWFLPLDGNAACRASQEALCLRGGRFKVEARWRDFRGRSGTGHAESLSADTGYFWFFDAANVEVVTKVLDGRPNNQHFWTFYGALSSVEYWLTVTDSQTGAARRYFNSPGVIASVGDTRSFGPQGASLTSTPESFEAAFTRVPQAVRSTSPLAGQVCEPSATRLCLNGGRFAVEMSWRDPRGREGVGTAVPLSADTGTFWFFDAANVETVVKVLDGRLVNGHYWLFYGSLSNVDFDLQVTDTETGETRTYQNRGRRFGSVGDTRAFAGE